LHIIGGKKAIISVKKKKKKKKKTFGLAPDLLTITAPGFLLSYQVEIFS
jgi:hypothetical protein